MQKAASRAATWRVSFSVPVDLAAPVVAWVDASFPTYSAFEQPDDAVRFDLLVNGDRPAGPKLELDLALIAKAEGMDAPMVEIEEVPDADWRAVTYAAFPPVRIGRFVIHGSHHADAVGPGALGLQIDAATAFGTGEHPTTEGCILALQEIAKSRRPRRLLDLGCGSGILAMAMVRLWRRPVLAVDVDAEAVRVTRENAGANGMGALIDAVEAGNPLVAGVARRGPFDLVVANILARPLIGLSPAIAREADRGATIVLSGLLTHQAPAVLAWYRLQGFALKRHIRVENWSTLVLQG